MQTLSRHATRSACLRRLQSAQVVRPAGQNRRRTCAAYASEGVQDLLARDLKQPKLAKELIDTPLEQALEQFETPDDTSSSSSSSSSSSAIPARGRQSRRKAGPKSKQQRRQDMAEAADAAADAAPAGPQRCKEAIDEGLAKFAAKDYQAAIELFNLALELPGNGAYRVTGSPREYSCPSDAEENAALYNLACCYAQLQQRPAALACLEAILENGFDDVATLKSDPDLAPVRGSEFDSLLFKYTGVGGAFTKLFTKKEKVIVSDANKNKPWILW